MNADVTQQPRGFAQSVVGHGNPPGGAGDVDGNSRLTGTQGIVGISVSVGQVTVVGPTDFGHDADGKGDHITVECIHGGKLIEVGSDKVQVAFITGEPTVSHELAVWRGAPCAYETAGLFRRLDQSLDRAATGPAIVVEPDQVFGSPGHCGLHALAN
jgi:hypothetical protein